MRYACLTKNRGNAYKKQNKSVHKLKKSKNYFPELANSKP